MVAAVRLHHERPARTDMFFLHSLGLLVKQLTI